MHELTVVTITAASIGLFHTLLGPDHYLPFIVMAQARKWSLVKTTCITALCGAGHVLKFYCIRHHRYCLGDFYQQIRGNRIIPRWTCGMVTHSTRSGVFCLGIIQCEKKPATRTLARTWRREYADT